MVGNRDREVPPMGWTFPLPEDDTWSCEGTEEHSLGHLVEQENFVDEAMEPPPHHQWIHLTKEDTETYRNTCEGEISQRDTGFSDDLSSRDTIWDCRAASGSTAFTISSASRVGENTCSIPLELSPHTSIQGTIVAGVEQLDTFSSDPPNESPILTTSSLPAPATPHGPWLTLTGGASSTPATSPDTEARASLMSGHYYTMPRPRTSSSRI